MPTLACGRCGEPRGRRCGAAAGARAGGSVVMLGSTRTTASPSHSCLDDASKRGGDVSDLEKKTKGKKKPIKKGPAVNQDHYT